MREVNRQSFWRAVLAEFLGVTIFVFLSTGSATKWTGSHIPADIVQIALTFGLSIATLAQCLAHISGAHLNPAVTFGLLVGCQISLVRAAAYIGAQVLGGVAASAILLGLTPPSRNSTLGLNAMLPDLLSSFGISCVLLGSFAVTNSISLAMVLAMLSDGVTPGQGLGVELIITFQLVLCVFATTDKRRSDLSGSGPLAIGLSVAIGHLMAIGFTGCGMNPARSFGPAAVTGDFRNHWLYWVGPIIGGAAAALLYDFVLTNRYQQSSDRLKVLTGSQGEEYEVDGDQDRARMEMKPR